ncbi:MAG: Crp/Fnr family transcriptional regulator [Bacteroidota bacterium]
MEAIKVKRGEVLQSPEALNTKVYHVKSGLLRSYAVDQDDKENIFMFAPEGWVIADNVPPEKPAVLFIDAIEDSVVIVLPKDLEREKRNVAPIFKRLESFQERILMLISSNAIERYEKFVDMYPSLVQRVPQRMIASYIGVTPETLSAAKSKRSKNSK